MTITLYRTADTANTAIKTLTNPVTVEGVLRGANTDILNPVVEMASPSADPKANYAYIPEFNRYYFITGFTKDINGLLIVSMHVDVLMTYYDQYANCICICARTSNEDMCNKYYQDPYLKTYYNKRVGIQNFTGAFGDIPGTAGSGTFADSNDKFANDRCYVLIVAGPGSEPTT